VHVVGGAECFEPASAREREALRFAYAAADERMGCQLWVRADAEGTAELVLSAPAEERS
jgi:ferredoxin